MNILTRAVRKPPSRDVSEKVVGLLRCDPACVTLVSRTHKNDLFCCLSDSYPGGEAPGAQVARRGVLG